MNDQPTRLGPPRWPAYLVLAPLWCYRRLVSPVLPAVFGPSLACRYHPSCSVYAIEAVTRHGALHGSWLAFKRLLRCNPRFLGGYDPVPARPRCERVA